MMRTTNKLFILILTTAWLVAACEDGSGSADGPPSPEAGKEFAGAGGDWDGAKFTDENGVTCSQPSACGNCDLDCRADGFDTTDGGGTDDVNRPDTELTGVIETQDGVTVDVEKVEKHFIWVANSGEGTVSKVDTRTYEEVARYISGPDGQQNDPSRTSVNAYGDVFVGNRQGRSVTKISVLEERCPDTNGDGQITTSTGPDNVLPWGQDDCVLWNTRLVDGDIIRAVAAQDAISFSDDSKPPVKAGVWIGGWDGVAWKLNSDTGAVELRTTTPTNPYGFALDKSGNLWMASRERAFGRIDTTRCVDDASCNVNVCGDEGDSCIKQKIGIDAVPYGITVDFKQRVWLGGDKIVRYDPKEPQGQRLTYVQGNGSSIWVHGVQADLDGNIWGAAYNDAVVRVDADDPQQVARVPGTEGSSTKGIAVDLDGKVWSINLGSSDATVITPGQAITDNNVVANVTDFVYPYTYSDMTGSQLQFATDQTGFYRQTLGGCDGTISTEWLELQWTATVPEGTRIAFVARGAATQADLAGKDWVAIAKDPGDVSPFNLAAKLGVSGLQGMKFLEVEAQLTAKRQPDDTVIAPTLHSMKVTYHCGVPDDGGGNNNGGPNNDGGPNNNGGMCKPANAGCSVGNECCSGICGSGVCVTN